MQLKRNYKGGVSIADIDNRNTIEIERRLHPSKILEIIVLKRNLRKSYLIFQIGEYKLFRRVINKQIVNFDRLITRVEKIVEENYEYLEKFCDNLFKKFVSEIIWKKI